MAKLKPKVGAPSLGDRARTVEVKIRFRPAEYDAIRKAVERENEEIARDQLADDEDRKSATVASWIRDAALDSVGLLDGPEPSTPATLDPDDVVDDKLRDVLVKMRELLMRSLH